MAHLDNRSELLSAHVTLLSLGTEIIESVSVRRHDLAITPIDRKNLPEGEKAYAISITMLMNGKPSDNEAAREELMTEISRIIARRHPSERDAVEQDGLTIKMRPEAIAAHKEAVARRERLKAANVDRRGLLVGHGEPKDTEERKEDHQEAQREDGSEGDNS